MKVPWRVTVIVLAILAWCPGLCAGVLEGLRGELRRPAEDLVLRGESIRRWVGQLKSLDELQDALSLPEWRDLDADDAVAATDRAARAALLEEFRLSVQAAVARGDADCRVAVADLLGTLGPESRGVGTHDGLGRTFGPELARLARDKDPRVRVAAARALGQSNPEPGIAGPALDRLLGEPNVLPRLAAARALVAWADGVAGLAGRSRSATGVRMARRDVVEAGVVVVPIAGHALNDSEAAVRLHGAAAIGRAAGALAKLLLAPDAPDTPRDTTGDGQRIGKDWQEIRPLLLCLGREIPALVRATNDWAAEVRRQARLSLEELTGLRSRWRQRAAACVRSPLVRCTLDGSDDPLLDGLIESLAQLTAAVSASDVETRRATLNVLETMGAAATPALRALVAAADDPDRFVRRAAVRTLGQVDPVGAGAPVPVLALRLADADLDVRLAAAASLENLGPASGPALPALVGALRRRDEAEMRLALCRVLEQLGEPARVEAVPALAAAVSDKDARVRRSAARVLGGIGPAARSALAALRQAQDDADPAVQLAADAAIVRITRKPAGN